MSYLFADEDYEVRASLREYCKHHPTEQIVSDCGMFDAPCGMCEYEGDTFSRWAEVFAALPVACEWSLSPIAPVCRDFCPTIALPCLTAERWEAYMDSVMRAYDEDSLTSGPEYPIPF